MRKFFVSLTLLLAIAAVLASTSVLADDAKDGKTAQAAKDPNFRWHNGQWWYWVPAQQHWLVWNGSQWTPSQAGQASRGGVRSYSYAPGTQADARVSGAPRWRTPDSVSNTQIMGSYGFHSAGAKALGNY